MRPEHVRVRRRRRCQKSGDRLGGRARFRAGDAGSLTQARHLEPFTMLWISMAYGLGQGPKLRLARGATVSCNRRGRTTKCQRRTCRVWRSLPTDRPGRVRRARHRLHAASRHWCRATSRLSSSGGCRKGVLRPKRWGQKPVDLKALRRESWIYYSVLCYAYGWPAYAYRCRATSVLGSSRGPGGPQSC